MNADKKFDILIKKLLDRNNRRNLLNSLDIQMICTNVRELLLKDPMLLEIQAPVNVIGDIHGQYADLLNWFKELGYPPTSNFLFLGDYVDRGQNSIETICLLFAYKIRYPTCVYLLRGNHESSEINKVYGFYDECKRRFSVNIWKCITDCFNCLPIAALINYKIFCCHGGLSQYLEEFDQIRSIKRPLPVPNRGLMCDLLWADPNRFHMNGFTNSHRGISFTFGEDVVFEFLAKHNLELVCRAHEFIREGYEYYANRSLVTVFSAPNYGSNLGNSGGALILQEDMTRSFLVITPKRLSIINGERVNVNYKLNIIDDEDEK